MRVLHLLSSTGYHGAENMAAELIRQLSGLGIKNHIGVFYGQNQSNKEILDVISDHVENSVIFPCRGKIDVRTALLLHKYIKNNDLDIIHSHKYKTNLYSLLARTGTRCKLVSTCHNWLGDNVKMRFYAGMDKKLLKRFDAVVGVSHEVTNELIKHVRNNKVKRIDNGIDITKFCRVKEKDEAKEVLGLGGKKVVGFVGRLTPEKGVVSLIDAVRNLLNKGLNVAALIVGDGEYSQPLKDYADSSGISDRVVFTGKRNDTPLLYSAMDVFVLPSLKEAFPMVILEAMASSVPVVATNVGDIPWMIDDEISGILVRPGDSDAISKSIGGLLSNEDKLQNIALAGFKKMRENYTSFVMASKYQNVYQKVLIKGGL